ncbi:cytosolic sulfotransferase 9-like [Panicum virgatum]|uniref:cytosolic sulfotransferase 9-like n=1 Tax=Panicum virgatum TaxID=38727 RepID=UPI0019D56B18|nr:cytosolic sulfotransferase 9-like [Panicum virgatum]
MAAGEGDESTQTNDGGILPANFAEISLLSLPEVHARFALSPTDVLVASFPTCGTTWLKSLCFATARRSSHPPLDCGHPLLRHNAHDCVRSIDTLRFLHGDDDGEAPRLLWTHLHYSLLPVRATADDCSVCRIVYVIRDLKDTLVSLWHFNSGVVATTPRARHCRKRPSLRSHSSSSARAATGWVRSGSTPTSTRRRACGGLAACCGSGRQQWYEGMLRDAAGNLRKITTFMGCQG